MKRTHDPAAISTSAADVTAHRGILDMRDLVEVRLDILRQLFELAPFQGAIAKIGLSASDR